MNRILKTGCVAIYFSMVVYGCAGTQTAPKEKAEALRNYGSSLVQEGNLRSGLAKLLEAVELDPTDPETHHELALVYRSLREYTLSLNHFKKALSLKPDTPEYQYNMGTVYLKQRQWDYAIESFQKAAGNLTYKTPHYAYNTIGLTYLYKGEYQKSIYYFEKAVRTAPTYSPAYTNMGLALERLNKWEDALGSYKKAIAHNPSYVSAHFNFGRLASDLNRRDEAVKALQQTIMLDPRGPFSDDARKILKKIR